MAKLAPGDLAQVLSRLPQQNKENVIVGYETADDAGVFRLDAKTALVQTLDFFTPVTDDPETYGRIAAVNSLNDVYAMGGVPLTALSIVCYPQKGDLDVLGEILLGGQKALNEEDVVVLGGHSVDDPEIKFGYSVTGKVHPDRVVLNSGAKEGDVLVLTKPIGTGVISTGVKFGKAGAKAREEAERVMTISGREASKAMREVGVSACTDVTGFGLLGHAYEMAGASRVTLLIEADAVPLLPSVPDLVRQKMLTRGDRNNREYVGDTIAFAESVSGEMQSILYDPQTAGGLLISVPAEKATELLEKVPGAARIGRVSGFEEKLIRVK